MAAFRRLLRNDGVRRALGWVAAQYIRLVGRTGAWQVIGEDIPQAYWDTGKPFILCFWHGRMLMMPLGWPKGRPVRILISQHRDGQLIAGTIGRFGIGTVRGSSTRGAAGALKGLLEALKAGVAVGMTPDGPRGPRMRAHPGIANLARLSGAPILPCTYSASRRRVADSWDRFVVALPFARGVFMWGRPIHVAGDADEQALEDARRAVEEALNRLTEAADRWAGQGAIEPAPAEAAGAS